MQSILKRESKFNFVGTVLALCRGNVRNRSPNLNVLVDGCVVFILIGGWYVGLAKEFE